MEPDDRREKKSKAQQLEFGELMLKTEETKSREGKQCDHNLGIDVDGIKEHRRGEAKKKPKAEGQSFLLPLLEGKQKDL
jgi:hypothetical protein